jgi:hypothetical protein
MQSQKGFASVLLILLLILATVGGLFYYGVTKGNLLKTTDPNLDTTQKFDEQLTSKPTNDLSTWKTYTNNNFTFKYPDTWTLKEDNVEDRSWVYVRYQTKVQDAYVGSSIMVYSSPAKNTTSAADWLRAADIKEGNHISVIEENQKDIKNFGKTIKLNGTEVINVKAPGRDEFIITIINSQGYLISLQGDPNIDNISDNFLKTFKFIDQPHISIPQPNTKVTNPLSVKGTAPSNWFFEGQIHLKVVDENKNIIAGAAGTEVTPGSWMEDKPVEFMGTITFTTSAKKGFLIIENDNPSGLPENQKSYEIPVTF